MYKKIKLCTQINIKLCTQMCQLPPHFILLEQTIKARSISFTLYSLCTTPRESTKTCLWAGFTAM